MSREQIERLNAELTKIIAAKDLTALVAMYEEDAWLLPPGAPVVQGRDAISARFNAFMSTVETLDMQFEVIDVVDAGDVLVDLAHIRTAAQRRDGEAHHQKSKHIVIWRKQSDGTFKIAAEAINRDA